MIISEKENGRLFGLFRRAPVTPCTRRIPGISSPVYAILFSALCFFSVAPPQASLRAESPYRLSFTGGYAWRAAGSIVEDSGAGLDLIEGGINTGILYSPGYSEITQTVGPVYSIPDFSLSSRSFQIGLSRFFGSMEYGVALGYIDIVGSAKVPMTALNVGYFDPSLQGLYLPVTSRSSTSVFATDLSIEGFALYHLNPDDGFDLFGGAGLGAGRGWLAGFGSGPYLTEAHASLHIGLGYRAGGILYYVRGTETWFAIKSAPTSFVDRREVLVNPRSGNIRIGRAEVGISIPVF